MNTIPDIELRLIGFGAKASGLHAETRAVREGTTARDVWEALRSSAEESELLSRMAERSVLVHISGKLVQWGETDRTVLGEGDALTFMVLSSGG